MVNSIGSPTETAFQRISSGKKLNTAADDAAGIAIDSKFTSQIKGLNQSIRNAGDGISYLQVRDSGLQSINENLQRIRELSVQAGNGIYSQQDLEFLQKEADQLSEEVSRIIEDSQFNGKPLYNEAASSTFQVGPNEGNLVTIEQPDLRSISEKLDSVDLSDAGESLNTLDELLNQVIEQRVETGAGISQLSSVITQQEETSINAAEARSRIADADLAQETSNLVADQIREQAGIAMQAQANANQGQILKLIS